MNARRPQGATLSNCVSSVEAMRERECNLERVLINFDYEEMGERALGGMRQFANLTSLFFIHHFSTPYGSLSFLASESIHLLKWSTVNALRGWAAPFMWQFEWVEVSALRCRPHFIYKSRPRCIHRFLTTPDTFQLVSVQSKFAPPYRFSPYQLVHRHSNRLIHFIRAAMFPRRLLAVFTFVFLCTTTAVRGLPVPFDYDDADNCSHFMCILMCHKTPLGMCYREHKCCAWIDKLYPATAY